MLLLRLTCCWRAISILWLGAFRWFKNDPPQNLLNTSNGQKRQPFKRILHFPASFCFIHYPPPLCNSGKSRKSGAADRFSPGSPWQKRHSSMACFHQVVAEVVAVLAGASDLKQLSFRRLHCTMNWAADDLLCTCDAVKSQRWHRHWSKTCQTHASFAIHCEKMAIEAAHALAILSTKAVRRTDSITNWGQAM